MVEEKEHARREWERLCPIKVISGGGEGGNLSLFEKKKNTLKGERRRLRKRVSLFKS